MGRIETMEKVGPMKDKKVNGFDEWECESFADTLIKAGEILSDPKKMKAASSYVAKKKKGLKTLESLKKLANSAED